MSAPVKQPRLTPEEYLAIERAAEFRSEYFAGEMFAMAGGTPQHSLIGANTLTTLSYRLRSHRCTAYNQDLRIAIAETGLFTYPDISIFCEPLTFVDGRKDTATNPTLLVEVLSESTEAYDRGKKFELYRRLASLREYVLVSQSEPLVERYIREGDGRWLLTTAAGMEASMPLESLGVEMPLAEVYAKVDWDVPPAPIR